MARRPKPQTPSEPSPMATLPPYEVETWSIDRIKPDPANARVHGAKQIEQLRTLFRRYGQVWPVLVREDGTLIAGHGRLEAAKGEGFSEVRVIVARGWSEQQCRAFALADNKVALNATWDDEKLAEELARIAEDDPDHLGLTGFTDKELARALGTGDAPDSSPQLNGLQYSVVVRCADEIHQSELLAQLETQGLTCEALIS